MGDQDAADNIVAFRRPRGDMAHPLIAELMQYWDELRGSRLVPTREELDPRQFPNALPHAFILDRPRAGTIRFRLAGQHLNAVMGMEVRGMPVRALVELPARRRLMEQVEAVFTAPALLEVQLTSARGDADPLQAQMCLMPLRSRDGEIDRALGLFVTRGNLGAEPARFRPRAYAQTPILRGVPLSENQLRQLHPPGLAEEQTPFLAPVPASPRVPYRAPSQPVTPRPSIEGAQPRLRVIEGGRR